LNNWPVDFDRIRFFDQMVRLVVENTTTTTDDVLRQLRELIESQSVSAAVNGKVSESL
jgi:hypothetical protein